MNFKDKDPYTLLQISKDAGPSEIKRAYRRLVRRLHPDVCGMSMANIKRFLDIKDAYSYLIQKHSTPSASCAESGRKIDDDKNHLKDGLFIFKTLSLKEALHGTKLSLNITKREDFCPRCRGLGKFPAHTKGSCSKCSGNGYVFIPWAGERLKVVCSRCSGTGARGLETCPVCKGRGKVFKEQVVTVSIPGGVKDGQTIRFPGAGPIDPATKKRTPLFVTIEVKLPEGWQIRERDIVSVLEVDCWTCLGGGNVCVKTMDGETTVWIRPGTVHGDTVVLPGCGWIGEDGSRGDHICKIKVKSPVGPCPPLAKTYLNILKSLWPAKGFEYKSLADDRKKRDDRFK